MARLLSRALNEAYVYADEHSQLIAAVFFARDERVVYSATPQSVLTVQGITVPAHARRLVAYETGVLLGDATVLRRLQLQGTPNVVADVSDESNAAEWSVAINDAAVDRTNLTVFVQIACTARNTTDPLSYGTRVVTLWWVP
jgi:hypothetical protein